MCTAHSKGTSQDVPGCWPLEASRVRALRSISALGGGRLLHSLSLERLTDFNPDVCPHFPVPAPIGRVTVSNVTGTGFHVAWAADLALQPTFQLTLTAAGRPAVHLQTRNASLAVGGLEPGVLHLVAIVARACGAESASAHLRVRTGTFPEEGRGAGSQAFAAQGLEERASSRAAGHRSQRRSQRFELSWPGQGSWTDRRRLMSGEAVRGQGAKRLSSPRLPAPAPPRPRPGPAPAPPLAPASSWRCGRETLEVQASCASPSLSSDPTGSGFQEGRWRVGRTADP